MKNLPKFVVAISLTLMLAGTALADCPAPIPGEINAPPCTSSAQQITDNPSVETTTTAISSEVEIITINAVIGALESLLTVY